MLAHPWMPGRRNGSARGNCNQLRVDGRFVGRVILNEAQYCPNATLSTGEFPAYRMVFGASPADLVFERNTSVTIQFAPQGGQRVMAQDAMPKEMTDSNLRRILDRN